MDNRNFYISLNVANPFWLQKQVIEFGGQTY